MNNPTNDGMEPMIAEAEVRFSVRYSEDVSEEEAVTAACEALNEAIESAEIDIDSRHINKMRFYQVVGAEVILEQKS